MFRKTMSFLMIAVLAALMLSAAPASAAGLFGELARDEGADPRLAALDNVAEPLSVSYTTEDGVAVEICQAFFEGNRVYLSYRLTGSTVRTELHDGVPEDGIRWDEEYQDFVAAEQWSNDSPELQKEIEWLDGTGQRWAESRVTSVSDGITLSDGTYADITAGIEKRRQNGSVAGWKECLIPEENLAETLTFQLNLRQSREILFQDGKTLKRLYEDLGRIVVPFTLARNGYACRLHGTSASGIEAAAEFTAGRADLKGTVRVVSPEQARGWTAWQEGKDDTGTDLIMWWNLYQNGEPVDLDGDGGSYVSEDSGVVFELQYPLLSSLEGLSLVPEYSDSGEHPEEAVALQPVPQE